MSIKEIKFYVINFIETPKKLFKNKILTPRAKKTHIQISHKEGKSEGRRCV